MSMFTSKVTEAIALPSGLTATIAKLTPRALHEAQKAQQKRSMADLLEMGGAEFQKTLNELQAVAKPKDEGDETPAPTPDPMQGYDRETLVLKGVKSWSDEAPITAETVADLDEEHLDGLARAVLKLSRPALFQTTEQAAAAEKNG